MRFIAMSLKSRTRNLKTTQIAYTLHTSAIQRRLVSITAHIFDLLIAYLWPARPCDEFGNCLDDFVGPPPPTPASFAPFDDRGSFDFAYFHFVERQDSAAAINRAIDMQAALLASHGVDPTSTQWASANEMYAHRRS